MFHIVGKCDYFFNDFSIKFSSFDNSKRKRELEKKFVNFIFISRKWRQKPEVRVFGKCNAHWSRTLLQRKYSEACTCTKNFGLVGALLYILWNGQVICPLCSRHYVVVMDLPRVVTQHNAQGWDNSMTLRYGLVDSTIIKTSYSIEILITIRSVWSSPEDYVIECGQEIIKGITLWKGSGPSPLCPETKEWPLVLSFPSGIHWLKL